ELLDGLLDISRLDVGALNPEITTLNAAELLEQLAEQYRPMAEKRGLQLRVRARPLFIRSDRRLLRRMLQNFLANALRYTRSGGILLTARRKGTHILLQVWDTGPGIPEQHLRQIYDEFQRYEQPFVWDGRGLGLGLSICQRISLRLEHELGARSVVGQGSRFSVMGPATTAPLASTLPLPAHTPAVAKRRPGLRV